MLGAFFTFIGFLIVSYWWTLLKKFRKCIKGQEDMAMKDFVIYSILTFIVLGLLLLILFSGLSDFYPASLRRFVRHEPEIMFLIVFIIVASFIAYQCKLYFKNTKKPDFHMLFEVINRGQSKAKEDNSKAPVLSNNGILFCKYCGKKVDADSVFCSYCGNKIQSIPQEINLHNDNSRSEIVDDINNVGEEVNLDKEVEKVEEKEIVEITENSSNVDEDKASPTAELSDLKKEEEYANASDKDNKISQEEDRVDISIKVVICLLAIISAFTVLYSLEARFHFSDYLRKRSDTTVIMYPHYETRGSTIAINKVTLTPDETIIDFVFYNASSNSSWCNIRDDAYLSYNDRVFNLKDVIGINVAPKETTLAKNESLSFSLIFPSLPSDVESFDFIETDGWEISNIQVKQEYYHERDNAVKEIISNMVEVKGGEFMMGNNSWENCSPQFKVELSDYYICKYEVTQKEWELIVGNNPSYHKGAYNPVTNVNWNQCREFIKRLSNLSGLKFRLPTEAEWEYAARGCESGRDYMYAGSNNLDDVAWYADNSNGVSHPVGQKEPNELGLYDMSGNVSEWCEDWYGQYNDKDKHNPTGSGPNEYDAKVLRGESFAHKETNENGFSFFWVFVRNYDNPSKKYSDVGFRLAMDK